MLRARLFDAGGGLRKLRARLFGVSGGLRLLRARLFGASGGLRLLRARLLDASGGLLSPSNVFIEIPLSRVLHCAPKRLSSGYLKNM